MIVRSSHILLLAFLAVLTTAQNAHAMTSAQLKQKAAEEQADRVMRRFYDTLDFGAVYREMYVSEPLRNREVRAIITRIAMQNSFGTSPAPTFDLTAMERAYIAKRNFDFLVSAQNFTYDGDKDSFGKDAAKQIDQYYMPMMSLANYPILTSEQLDSRFTANMNHMSEFLRRFVVSKNLGTTLYRKRIALFKESNPPEEDLMKFFGLRKKIYIVRRERLHLYFVEENGNFRMLSVTSRVMD